MYKLVVIVFIAMFSFSTNAYSYMNKIAFKYRGIGDVSTSHTERLFLKVNNRYGVLNLDITPSRNVFFEYFLNRESNHNELNIPSFMGELGEASDYCSCPGTVSTQKDKQQRTLPGSCAELGLRRKGCCKHRSKSAAICRIVIAA